MRPPPRSPFARPRPSISPMDPNPTRSTINSKPVLWREAKTVLNLKAEEFGHKLLCDGITLNLGDACAYGCAFCYVESQIRKLVAGTLKAHAADKRLPRPPEPSEVVIRRRNALDLLRGQLFDKKGRPKFDDPSDTRVVFTSTLVDVAANGDLLRESAEAIKLIMEATHWQVRVLSKSHRLPDLVDLIPEQYRRRLIMGVSTGTLDDKLARAIEIGTPLVSKRIKSLHEMQDNGIRTFGMICPSLPQDDYDKFSLEICEAIRVGRCEHVWTEVMNVRGQSFSRTREALEKAGFTEEARKLAAVSGPGAHERWEQYARDTFLAHAKNVPSEKLRCMQYVEPHTFAWWKEREPIGAVPLGRATRAPGPRKGHKEAEKMKVKDEVFKPEVVLPPTLTAEEAKELKRLEATVDRGVEATFEMWLALHEIRTYENGLLYRSQGFDTFEDYCRSRWDYAKSHAYRLAACGQFVATLSEFHSPKGESLPLPRSEAQIRPILELPEDRRLEAWAHAIEVAPPEELTGRIVAARVREFSGKKAPRKSTPEARALRALGALRAAVEGLPEAAEIGRRLRGVEGLIRKGR